MKSLSKILIYFFLVLAFPQLSEAAFTANKQYNNQATGANVNTWGIVLNSNFTTIDSNLGGTLTLSVAGSSNVTLSSAQAQNLIYDLTGALTGNIVVFFPAQGGFYYVSNQTTGAFTLTVEGAGGSSGVLIPQGQSLPVYVDNSTSPPTVTTAVFASAGANSNITSLTGLTTPLSHSQGGSPVYVGSSTGGTANAQTLATVVPANFTLASGNIVTGIASATNTGATTFAVNSTTATAMRIQTPSGLVALSGGEIILGNPYVWIYDGTFYELINPTITSVIASSHLDQIGSTQGDILYRGASSWAVLAPGTSGQVLKTQGASANPTWSTSGSIATVKRQVITSSGTYTPCTGLVYGDYEIFGGGGGGGGVNNFGNAGSGSGGGAGGYSRKAIAAATIGASQSITIGAAGTAGNSSGGNGGTGGTSSVGAILSATGGGGGAGATSSSPSSGGTGGVGSGGDINLTGNAGGVGSIASVNTVPIGGAGGSTTLGGVGAVGISNNPGAAAAANSGSGGSGASASSSGEAGGAGGSGFFIATEYCNQ